MKIQFGKNKVTDLSYEDNKVKSVLILEGLANLFVLVGKVIVALNTGSSAILSDALHSLADLFNNVIAFFMVRLSSMPPDDNHPYGHRKFEQLSVFILATLLSVMALEVIFRAFENYGNPIMHSHWGLIVMVSVVIINISISTWEQYWAKRLNSPILSADATHTFSDVMVTLCVIIGWQLSLHGFLILDFLCSIIVSAYVLYLAFKLFSESIPILVDEAAVEHIQVINSIEQLNQDIKVKRIRSRALGKEIHADIIVTINKNMTTNDSHKIADLIEQELLNKFGIADVIIHMEPECC